MIRMRKTDGTSVALVDEFKFVEICDMDGNVAELLIDQGDGSIEQITAGSPEASRYEDLFGVKFCEVRQLD